MLAQFFAFLIPYPNRVNYAKFINNILRNISRGYITYFLLLVYNYAC